MVALFSYSVNLHGGFAVLFLKLISSVASVAYSNTTGLPFLKTLFCICWINITFIWFMHGFIETQISVCAGLISSDTQISVCVWLISCILTRISDDAGLTFCTLDTQINVVEGWHQHSDRQFSVGAGLISCTLVHKLMLVQGWGPALWYTNQCFAGLTSCTLTDKSVFCCADILHSDTQISVVTRLTFCTLTQKLVLVQGWDPVLVIPSLTTDRCFNSDPNCLHENGKV